jgi:hypothetical protein
MPQDAFQMPPDVADAFQMSQMHLGVPRCFPDADDDDGDPDDDDASIIPPTWCLSSDASPMVLAA